MGKMSRSIEDKFERLQKRTVIIILDCDFSVPPFVLFFKLG